MEAYEPNGAYPESSGPWFNPRWAHHYREKRDFYRNPFESLIFRILLYIKAYFLLFNHIKKENYKKF